jgi:hypothetical protein
VAQADLEHPPKSRIRAKLCRQRFALCQQQLAVHDTGIAGERGNQNLGATPPWKQHPQSLAGPEVEGALRFKYEPDGAMTVSAGIAKHAMNDALKGRLRSEWIFVVMPRPHAAEGPCLPAMVSALRAVDFGAPRGQGLADLGPRLARLVRAGEWRRVAVVIGRLEHHGAVSVSELNEAMVSIVFYK